MITPTQITASLLSIAVFSSAQMHAATSTDSAQCKAQVYARFSESAPRDRFRFDNTSQSDWSVKTIEIALGSSEGNLIFDTQQGGMGVEVFQPYRQESSSASVNSVVLPNDGAQSIAIGFDNFPSGADYTFSIDVDDQLKNSVLGNIRVTGNEMTGATVRVEFVSSDGHTEVTTSRFSADNRAVLNGDC